MCGGLVISQARLEMFKKQISTPSPPSLCFVEAWELYAAHEISWEEYLRNCLLHYVEGFVPHEDESKQSQQLMARTSFGFTLWSFQHEAEKVKDVSQLEAVFHAYTYHSVEDVKAKLDSLPESTANVMRKALVLLAINNRMFAVLKYILDDGQESYDPPNTSTFADFANRVKKAREPKLHEVIEQSRWKEIQKQPGVHSDGGDPKGKICGAPPGTAEIFDMYW